MEALGEKLGVGRSAINKWEKGKVSLIKRSHILEMAKIFGCDPAWLGGYKEEIETFDTPEEFELRWHQIGGGRHPLELTDHEHELILEYRVAPEADKKMVERILAYASKLKENEDGKP